MMSVAVTLNVGRLIKHRIHVRVDSPVQVTLPVIFTCVGPLDQCEINLIPGKTISV